MTCDKKAWRRRNTIATFLFAFMPSFLAHFFIIFSHSLATASILFPHKNLLLLSSLFVRPSVHLILDKRTPFSFLSKYHPPHSSSAHRHRIRYPYSSHWFVSFVLGCSLSGLYLLTSTSFLIPTASSKRSSTLQV